MAKKYILILLVCCSGTVLLAQEKTKQHRFHTIADIVLVNGSNGVSGALQFVHGFRKGNWFGGLGAGMDFYQYRSVPVYADFRYQFGGNRNKYFAYADAGANFPWVKEEPQSFIWGGQQPPEDEYSTGFYSDMGLGISIAMKNDNAFLLTLGYSRKTMEADKKTMDWRTQEWTSEIFKYRFNRVVIKLGFRF